MHLFCLQASLKQPIRATPALMHRSGADSERELGRGPLPLSPERTTQETTKYKSLKIQFISKFTCHYIHEYKAVTMFLSSLLNS